MNVRACQLRQLIVCPRVLEYDGIHDANKIMFNALIEAKNEKRFSHFE
jgi:hypothetical protein